MDRRAASLVAVAVAVVAVLGVAVAIAVTDADDAPRLGHAGDRHGMQPASEYAYLAEMVAHHEEAVESAEQLKRSDRAEMRDFAATVIDTQSAQIDQMKSWLSQRYPDRTGTVDYEPMMRHLTQLSGDRLDRVFLEDMIGHHMAAVMMSQQLLLVGDAAEHDDVTKLATSIRDEQRAEIVQMQQWLKAWFGVEWHHGMSMGDGSLGQHG